MDADGLTVLREIVISTNTSVWASALASNGTDFLIVWQEYDTRVLWGSLVRGDGSSVISTQLSTLEFWHFAVAASGQEFVIAAQRAERLGPGNYAYGMYTIRVGSNGERLRETRVAGDAYTEYAIKVASDGDTAFIAWRDRWSRSPEVAIRGLLVRADDTSPGPFTIFQERQGVPVLNTLEGLDVSWTGDSYFLAWSHYDEDSDLYSQRFTAAGAALDAEPVQFRLPGQQLRPVISFAQGVSILVWDEASSPSAELDVYFLAGRVRQPADMGVFGHDRVLASRSSEPQSGLALASDGIRQLAVWREGTSKLSLRAALIEAQDGLATGPDLEVYPSEFDQLSPSVAFGRDHYLITWGEIRHEGLYILGRRFTRAAVPAGEAFLISQGRCPPNPGLTHDKGKVTTLIAGNDQTFLVAWSDCRFTSAVGAALRAARVSDGGMVLDPIPLEILSPNSFGYLNPALASNGTHFLLAWLDEHDNPYSLAPPLPYPLQIKATRIDAAGQVLDQPGFWINRVDTFPLRGSRLAIASDSPDFLLAWSAVASGESFIHAAKVSRNGFVASLSVISAGLEQRLNPDVAWAEQSYLIAWHQGDSCGEVCRRSAIFGAWFRPPDWPSDSVPNLFRITRPEQVAANPRLAPRGDSRILIGYRRPAPEGNYGGVRRLFLKELERPERRRTVRR